ncbi:4Fe-4S binding protein [Rhodospirillum rubrum]|uniref:4Fe-4S ferredoxin, iron-sulfur binding n=1 Tax=Rhodospirillum rubrum (strain ATCC 11170 / ATH 1.1.1 / DSM 467 / LMG 4362 / NCIMB 8255 / S1) TaxID=269796 RepID=Q2RXM2_RHORT|nr:4Fe-4S binding protein [Rhodospirillum rubrum]ABC21123.1 4Fe-4S ferredoxin, iron-sulfur binding [Rhodospirillum rubrum ATCC 11170]AEO46791.1 4Fe-4S ferredoxin, iron-sulfur binding protein [Rhodospirillum rubrum F11]MBK5952670.1 4Fe-4S ferredoxin [Rhodospirillum rubrum]QXG80815.1 4Fe-4S binding protein [Rhodospirillum rubrum]HAQ00446.1 4Fe-4S ferredoxin [Rhodospirillum rubrum]
MLSKIKEALICLRAGRVTLPYPFVPLKAPPRFRGRPTIDGAKCIGCGACAEVCPPRLIEVNDAASTRTVELNYSRCTYCARCQEICPTGAMTCTEDFEMATADRKNLTVSVQLDMVHCETCGKAFMTKRMLDKMLTEFCPPWMNKKIDVPKWLWQCPQCRLDKTGSVIEGSIKNG